MMNRAWPLSCLILPLLAAGALAAGDGESRELVSFRLSEMVWSLVTFLVFFGLLSVLVWPKILKGLQDRENRIRADLQNAQDASAKAQQALAEYQKQLTAAQQEVSRLIARGRQEGQRQANAMLEQARAEAQELRQRTVSEIRFAKENALAEIYEQTARISTQVAGRILGREIKPDDHRRLVDESLAQLKKDSN